MTELTKSVLNDPELIAIRDGWFDRLESVHTGHADVIPLRVGGFVGQATANPYFEPETWVNQCLENLAGRADTFRRADYFRPLCLEYWFYGVHFIDKLLGADVVFRDKQFYTHHLDTPIGSLAYPDLSANADWQLICRVVDAFLEADCALVLFGLPVLSSALNIAVNLYGEDILVMLMTEPEQACHDLSVINRLISNLHRYFLSRIPPRQLQPVGSSHRVQPPGYGQLCGCTSQLISGALYAEYFAPLDDEVLSIYPHGGMIHLCGAHTQHIEAFRNMKSLKSIQMNDRATADLEKFYNELRSDQVLYLNPCEVCTVEQAMQITGGNRLVVVC